MTARSATTPPATRGAPAANHAPPLDRRRAFTVILLIELWERFGYYGSQSILLLFMVQHLGVPDATANLLWGAFGVSMYAAPALGGLIGDRVLGTRRTMLLGAATLDVAYAVLALPLGDDAAQVTLALAIVVVGNGLFKPNAANLVRRIYEGDARLDAAFTIYYMAVNVGTTAATLLAPKIAERYGWHAAFAVSAAGLAAGLATYAALRRRVEPYRSDRDRAPLDRRAAAALAAGMLATVAAVALILRDATLARAFVWLAVLAVLATWTILVRTSRPDERAGLLAMIILTGQVMLFFIFYQQTSTSLTLFALREVALDASVAGLHLFRWSPAQFGALDPIWIVLLTPLLVRLYDRLAAAGREPPIGVKFLAGFGFLSAAFLLWWREAGGDAPVSSWTMVWAYGLFSAAELLTSGLGLAACARYVPARIGGLMIGTYFVALGIALYLGSAVANGAALPLAGTPAEARPLYDRLFLHLLLLALAGLLASAALLPALGRLDRRHRAPYGQS